MVKPIKAAGAVLWRREPGGPVVAVVHRPRYDDWTLPKGKLDPGESVPVAAVRELAEETGIRAVLGRHLRQVSHTVDGVPKTVDYFAAEAVDGSFAPNDEVDVLRWLPVDDATDLVSFANDRTVLADFAAVDPTATTTVLVVRHAHAGTRAGWDGPDAERPLSEVGQRQTRALTPLLGLFAPDRVHAVPIARCARTVEPLARQMGAPVTPEPELSEPAYVAEPARALERLREIAGDGGTPVVCSQGGVIPHLVAELTKLSGVDAARVRARKGSVWVLGFAGSEVVSSWYLARP